MQRLVAFALELLADPLSRLFKGLGVSMPNHQQDSGGEPKQRQAVHDQGKNEIDSFPFRFGLQFV